MRKLTFTFILTIAFLASAAGCSNVSAATFDPGRIIDDQVFTNSSTMSAAQIQAFLSSKVPTCDTSGTMPASDFGRPDITHAQYAALRGWSAPPYTCLKDYIENGTTAAQLIYNLAQQYRINPQALIVTLQKESSLVTDSWPLASQYRTATGYGCPDSGPNNSANCNSNYYGFTNQMDWTATLYRSVLNQSPTWYSPYVVGNNYVRWNPNAACGGSNVTIVNWSTAALYDYTPYQPNTAALNAVYGTGDNCSAYGNRNFWQFFNDWFGSTHAPAYSWSVNSQYAYTDATKTTPANMNTLMPGSRVYVGFTALNTGNQTWTNSGPSAILAGTEAPKERSSVFAPGSSWLTATKPSLMKEASVAPGQTGTFEFWMTVPASGVSGVYNERFNIVANGITWMNDTGLSYYMNIHKPTYTWSMASQYAYTDATKTTPANMNTLLPGSRVYVGFTARNTGNVAWYNSGQNTVMIGTEASKERSSVFAPGSSWLTSTRPALLREATVLPGQIGSFEFWMTVPANGVAGIYNERFNLVANGAAWMNDTGLSYYMNVQKPTYTWSMASQYAYTDATKTALANMNTLLPGSRVYVGFVARNTGNTTWYNSGQSTVMAGTEAPKERSSVFAPGSSWLTSTRPTLLKEASVAPGQTGTFEFWMTVPASGVSGVYNERFNIVANGITWMNDTGLSYYMNTN